EEADAAGGGREIAGDRVEQGRLSRPVGAQHAAPLAGLDDEVDLVDRGQRPEAAAHALKQEGVSGTGPLQSERLGHRACYLHSGLVRLTGPSFRNWSSGSPRVWLTCGITFTTLL